MTQTATDRDPGGSTEPDQLRAPLWTRAFILLCTISVLCYCANYLVGAVLPFYVQGLGGDPVITGLIFSSFSAASFVLRPLIGHLADIWSVRGTISIGAGLLGSMALVFIMPWLWPAFVANAFRGVGWGAFSSGSSTAVALLAPPARRGEASGQYSIAGTATQAFAPAFALWLLHATGNFTVIFVLAGLAGVGALYMLTQLPRVGGGTASFREALALPRGGVSLGTFVDKPVLLVSLLLVCVTLTAPVTFAFVPLHAASLGIENISLYFVAAGVTSITSRLVLGRLLDRGSRGTWIMAGYLLLGIAFLVLMGADSIQVFMVAGVLSALAQSLAQPSLMAFAIDRAASGRMGKAMATYSMFYRVGEGLGAPLAGWLIVRFGFSGMYVGAIVIVLTGVLMAAINWSTVGKSNARHAG